jgi:hypothetical protein
MGWGKVTPAFDQPVELSNQERFRVKKSTGKHSLFKLGLIHIRWRTSRRPVFDPNPNQSRQIGVSKWADVQGE